MTTIDTVSDLLGEARRAKELVGGHPRMALSRAESVLERAAGAGDRRASAVAEWTLGVASRQLGDLQSALRHLRAATALARKVGDREVEGEARTSLAAVLLLLGRTGEALSEMAKAEPLASGLPLARMHFQRGTILGRLARFDEALASYDLALAGFGGAGSEAERANVLRNRSIIHSYRHHLDAADADLTAAEALFGRAGNDLAVAETRHNRGYVAALRGDVPTALRAYEEADATFTRLGVPQPTALLDRCQALLSVGLAAEAHGLARAAADQLEAAGNEVDLAEARLVRSEAAMLAGDGSEAIEVVALARLGFVRQQRPRWAALARYQFLRASWYSGMGPTSADSVRAAARELDACGWVVQAADARVMAARLALERGQHGPAADDLGRVAPHRRRGPADLRVRAWHAEALLRLGAGHRRGALAALRQGLTIVEEQQASLGATELRVHAAAAATEMVTLGLGLALDTRRPSSVLSWAERFRATSLRVPPARPPSDPELADLLGCLRQVANDLREAGLAGRPTTGLRAEQARLEATIRHRARTAPGGGAATATVPTVGALAAALGERVLVEYVAFAGELWAVTVASGRARLWPLGDLASIRAETNQLRFALSRLVTGRDRPMLAEAASEAFGYAAARLDRLLVGPMARLLADRALVVVPTGTLHAVPWGVLPSRRGRPFTVAPSAGHWLSARDRPPRSARRAALVAGPGPATAPAEVAALAALYPEAISLVEEGATVAGALAAFRRSDLAHVAAHGLFRTDNPLFSAVQLADGPLTVYDLEGAGPPPSTIVLSTCDGGRSAVAPGDELMGLAATLLNLGATTVVGSSLPVPDESTRALMLAFHAGLSSKGPAAALAAAASEVEGELADRPGGGAALAAAAVGGFACYGDG